MNMLIRDPFIQDSFTEDTLLSTWDQLRLATLLTSGKEGCSEEQRTVVTTEAHVQNNGCTF